MEILKIGIVPDQLCGSLKTVVFHQDTSEQGYSSDPSTPPSSPLLEGSEVQTTVCTCCRVCSTAQIQPNRLWSWSGRGLHLQVGLWPHDCCS